jgi:uncharacterized protein (DUF2344 family)
LGTPSASDGIAVNVNRDNFIKRLAQHGPDDAGRAAQVEDVQGAERSVEVVLEYADYLPGFLLAKCDVKGGGISL